MCVLSPSWALEILQRKDQQASYSYEASFEAGEVEGFPKMNKYINKKLQHMVLFPENQNSAF